MLSTASVIAAVTDTGVDITGERAYLFDATFADVALAAATPYWFGVLNTATQNTFRWNESSAGLGSAISFNGTTWGPFTEASRTPLNFTLYSRDGQPVPEPASLAVWSLMVCVGFSIGWWQLRRTGAKVP